MIFIVPWVLNLEAPPPLVGPNGPTHYHVYANAGDGEPIDYSTAVATVDGLEWTTPVLDYPGVHRFGVRAFGSLSGLEEKNVDAAVVIILDDEGVDVTNRPAPIFGLRARCEAGGVVVAEWSHPGGTRENAPSGFRVYVGDPAPDHGAPVATVAVSSAFGGAYAARLTGVANGPLSVNVRAYNATAEEPNVECVSIVVDGTAPNEVDALTAEAVAG